MRRVCNQKNVALRITVHVIMQYCSTLANKALGESLANRIKMVGTLWTDTQSPATAMGKEEPQNVFARKQIIDIVR